MNPKRQFEVGKIYHIYNRGVAKCQICEGESDTWRMLQGFCLFNDKNSAANILWQLERDRGRLTLNVLKDYILNPANKRKPLVRILAYCIMPNHFHLLAEEIEKNGITKFMQKFGAGYARYFNNKHNRVGGLFQGRFKAVPVENEQQLLYLLVYINVINPGQLVEPNLKENGIKNMEEVLRKADEYQFGTHQEYIGKRGPLIIEKGIFTELLPTPEMYRELVESVLRNKKYSEIQHLFLE
ncbi:MAG: transposase [Candidatus Nealsonbacteria bacterium]|nr:transposase [Candidatus Nealsonbacteria bacterium]